MAVWRSVLRIMWPSQTSVTHHTCWTTAAGVNGAGKTTQLQIIMGKILPDSGEVIKAKRSMRIAYLAQVTRGAALHSHNAPSRLFYAVRICACRGCSPDAHACACLGLLRAGV